MHSENKTKEAASEIITKVISETTYLFLDPLEEESQPDPDTWQAIGVTIEFHGLATGTISLWVEDHFRQTAAMNMLGVDDIGGVSVEKQNDAIKEILNIVSGNLLTTLYGKQDIFELGIPTITQDAIANGITDQSLLLWYGTEETVLAVVITTK